MKKISGEDFKELAFQKRFNSSKVKGVLEAAMKLKVGQALSFTDSEWKLSSAPAEYLNSYLTNRFGIRFTTLRLVGGWAIMRIGDAKRKINDAMEKKTAKRADEKILVKGKPIGKYYYLRKVAKKILSKD